MRKRRLLAIVTAGTVVLGSVTGYLVVHRSSEPVTRTKTPTRFYEVNDTQKFRFQASRVLRDWERPRTADKAITQIRKAMANRTGKGFQLDPPGHDDWGPTRTLADTLHRLHRAIKQTHVGAIWRMRPVRNRSFVWRVRKIDIDPAKIANTEGTHAIDIIVGSTLHRFPHLNLIGIYSCRYVLGTSILSQHAYGNAVDWGGSVSLMDDVARWQHKATKRGWLPISQLLYRGHDWFSHSYVYDHFDHLHDSGKPLLSGGGCNKPGTASRIQGGASPVASAIPESGENE